MMILAQTQSVAEAPTFEELLEKYEEKLAELSALQAQMDYVEDHNPTPDQRVFLDSRAYKKAYNECLDRVLWY